MLFFIKKHFYGENFAFFDNSLYFCKKIRKESAKGEEPFVRSGCGFAEKLLNIKIE